MKKTSIVIALVCISFFSFTPLNESETSKTSTKPVTGITCRQWCSDTHTWADMWAMAAWDAQMQVDSPQVPREETSWTQGCGVGSAPNCVSASCLMICYGSFPQ